MFVFTAKFDKKRAVAAIAAAAVILIVIVLIAGRRGGSAEQEAVRSRTASTNEERVRFLQSYGWEVDENPVEEQRVIIPREFGDVYEEYNTLQRKQGFDLTPYAGNEATRYTYRILNFPDGNVSAVADIIVYRGEVVAGNVQSNASGGFMTTLDGADIR